jgi:hypothetical protein
LYGKRKIKTSAIHPSPKELGFLASKEKEIMVMLRPPGKAEKIAKNVMKGKGVKVPKANSNEKTKPTTPYLQH